MLPAGSGSGAPQSGPPFDHYTAAPATMYATADEIVSRAKGVLTFQSQVDTAVGRAVQASHGAIQGPIQAASGPMHQRARRVSQVTFFAGGCVRFWGNGITTFDQGVDKLNTEWQQAVADDFGLARPTKPDASGSPKPGDVRAADNHNDALAAFNTQLDAKRTAKANELRIRLGKLSIALDQTAQSAAGMLQRGPDQQSLQALLDAGALSGAALALFPSLRPDGDGTLPYDFKRLSNRDLAVLLARNPSLLYQKRVLDEIRRRLTALTAENGRIDGSNLRSAVSGSSLYAAHAGDALGTVALLGLYAGYAQGNDSYVIPDGAAAYLTSFYQELGADIAEKDVSVDVLDWINTQGQADRSWMLRGYANGLLAVSDDQLHKDFGYDQVPQAIKDALHDLPERVVTETHGESTRAPWIGVELQGGEGFREFAELIGNATIEPGKDFALDIDHSAGRLAGLLQEGLDNYAREDGPIYSGYQFHLQTLGPLLQDVVDVASRDEDANAALIHAAAVDPSSESANALRQLYVLEWPDDGRAVSGYTDWISEAYASGDPAQINLAKQASAEFIDFVTDTGGNGEPNTFRYLIRDGVVGDRTFGYVNPYLAQSFGGVAASNLESLAQDIAGDTGIYGGRVGVGDQDASRLFTLVATDPKAANDLSTTIGVYEARQLDLALRSGDPDVIRRAGNELQRLDGLAAAGISNASLVDLYRQDVDATAAYKQHLQQAARGYYIVNGALGYIPHAGTALSALSSLVYYDLITNEIQAPEPPHGYEPGAPGNTEAVLDKLRYGYLAAEQRAGEQLPAYLLDQHGRLKPIDHLGPYEQGKLDDLTAGDPHFQQYRQNLVGDSPWRVASINDQGHYHKSEVDSYLDGKP